MNGSPLRVRLAGPTDADGIAAVHIQSWRETYSGLISDRFTDAEALEMRRRMWASILARQPRPGVVAVAVRDRRVVGFAFAGASDHPDATKGIPAARPLHLYSIYLLADEHGTGTGSALLQEVLGDRPAQLWVVSTNHRARAFYERHGFSTDDATLDDPDLDGVVEVRMVR
ncbi:MAG: GNAT family N-acetyltransferase [Microbacterium gubbeenense]|uniref:GNAT family N-acetyltransferase n=3 Tax=Microbacterium gubbeenense TaxID=159896 RepID=UPI00049080D0|nr:GNAT family N-acetyltransferase [Microbacterium gubbeenense]